MFYAQNTEIEKNEDSMENENLWIKQSWSRRRGGRKRKKKKKKKKKEKEKEKEEEKEEQEQE